MTDGTFTPTEIENIRKGEQLLHPADRQALIEQQKDEATVAKAKREQVNLEQGAVRWDQFKRKVRREQAERAEQHQLEREAIAAMTPAEYDAWKKRVPVAVELAPRLPPRYQMAVEDNRRDDEKARNAEREKREQKAGIPKLEAASAARCQEIRDTADAAIAELDQRRRAVQERKLRELAEEEERHRAEVQAVRESLEAVRA
jgi:hypothetical protein